MDDQVLQNKENKDVPKTNSTDSGESLSENQQLISNKDGQMTASPVQQHHIQPLQIRPMSPLPMQENQGGVAVRPGAGNITNPLRQALQQLMQILRSPKSPLQQEQILTILKENPQLMAAFLKQKKEKEQAQLTTTKRRRSSRQPRQPRQGHEE